MALRRRSDTKPKHDPIREAIATRAYELFLARGAGHGHDLDDWLQAEREWLSCQHAGGAQATRRATP
jgi:DUF2934 family protein